MPAISAKEIVQFAMTEGTALVECDSWREATSTVNNLRSWLRYNNYDSEFKVSRSQLVITVTRSTP